ncbi:hypothetical protein STEG23_034348, partial [Scotinomys teguina]
PDQLLLLFDGFKELTSSLITEPVGLIEDWNQKLPRSLLLSSLLSNDASRSHAPDHGENGLLHYGDLKKVELTLSRDFYKELWPGSVDPSHGTQVKENKTLFDWCQDVCSVFETSEDLEVLTVSNSIMETPVMHIFATALKNPQCKPRRLQNYNNYRQELTNSEKMIQYLSYP